MPEGPLGGPRPLVEPTIGILFTSAVAPAIRNKEKAKEFNEKTTGAEVDEVRLVGKEEMEEIIGMYEGILIVKELDEPIDSTFLKRVHEKLDDLIGGDLSSNYHIVGL